MIVVDTSVWADWFNGFETVQVSRLNRALDGEDAGVTPVILAEVLQGFRKETDFDRARRILTGLPYLSLDLQGHVRAAAMVRVLRRRGVTIRGTIDCIIAQTCIGADVELLSSDQDFIAIAQCTPLRLCSL